MRKIERKSEQVEVNGKVFTINEITPDLVIDMIEGKTDLDQSKLKDVLMSACDITVDDIRELKITFGQLSEMYRVFKEVNAAFFTLLPLDIILAGFQGVIVNSIKQELSKMPVCSSLTATSAVGNMDGVISAAV